MKYIGTITNDFKQNLKIVLDDGSLVDLTLEFRPQRQGWYYSFTWGTFTANNRRLVTGPNILRAFRNILPFGFACTTTDDLEPIFQDDFSNGRAQFYVLNSTDVVAVETKISGFDERAY